MVAKEIYVDNQMLLQKRYCLPWLFTWLFTSGCWSQYCSQETNLIICMLAPKIVWWTCVQSSRVSLSVFLFLFFFLLTFSVSKVAVTFNRFTFKLILNSVTLEDNLHLTTNTVTLFIFVLFSYYCCELIRISHWSCKWGQQQLMNVFSLKWLKSTSKCLFFIYF